MNKRRPLNVSQGKRLYMICLTLLLMTFTTKAADPTAPTGYHQGDYVWLYNYMNAGGAGTENWRLFSFADEPEWETEGWLNACGVVWNDASTRRITKIEWNGNSLKQKMNGTLDVTALTELTKLDCYVNQLTSLNISGLTELTELKCFRNKLTSLNVSTCTALTKLDCSNNKLTSLNISGCTGLTNLNCHLNKLNSLDISDCMGLTYLNCADNLLTSLDVSDRTGLTAFECNSNQLTSLNVSGCTALSYFKCNKNLLTSLNVSDCTKLTHVECDKNEIISLDVSGFKELTYLKCSENQLTDLKVSGCTELTELYCPVNKLASLDVSELTGLTQLYCADNLLTSLNVSGCTGLTQFYFNKNQIADLDVSELTGLTFLNCHTNLLTDLDISALTKLKGFYCESNQLPLYQLPATTSITRGYTYAPQSPSITAFQGQTLTLANLGLTNGGEIKYREGDSGDFILWPDAGYTIPATDKLTLQFTASSFPDFNDTKPITYTINITTIPTGYHEGDFLWLYNYMNAVEDGKKNWKLFSFTDEPEWETEGWLDVNTTVVWSNASPRRITKIEWIDKELKGILDVTALTELIELDCSENELTDLDVSACTRLISLECNTNQLTDLYVTALTELISLNCSENQLTDLYVTALTELISLNCSENQLTDLDVTALTELISLNYSENQLTDLDISALTQLTSLDCSSNRFTSLDVSGCTKLYELYCTENQLTSLDVSALTQLTSLYCSRNGLTSLDVSKCTVLARLDCSWNQLTELDLSKCTKLTELHCSNNQLAELDVSALTQLTYLYCADNKLPLSQLPATNSITGAYDYAPQSPSITAYPGQTLTLADLELTNGGNIEYRKGVFGGFAPWPDAGYTIPADYKVGDKLTLKFTASAFPKFTSASITYTINIVPIPPSNPYTVDLTLGEGISANHPAGKLDVIEGEDFYLTFSSNVEGVSAEHFIFMVDGVETEFNNLGEAYHYTYNLSGIDRNHTISVSLRTNTVTIPVIEGATTTPGAGTHQVPYGQTFTFTLTLADDYDQSDVRILVNGNDVTPTLRATTFTVTLDRLTEPVSITILGVEKNASVGNADITAGIAQLTVDNGQLTIDSADGKTMDVSIYNLSGQVVAKRKVVGSGTFTLSAGIYLVRVDGEVYKVNIR